MVEEDDDVQPHNSSCCILLTVILSNIIVDFTNLFYFINLFDELLCYILLISFD